MAKKKKVTNSITVDKPNPNVVKMINYFGDILKLGYTDENWTEASRVLRDISVNVSQNTMGQLGTLWTEAYVNSDSVHVDTRLNQVIESLTKH